MASEDGTWRQGFIAQFPLDSPNITMVKKSRINNKSMSPSTIEVMSIHLPYAPIYVVTVVPAILVVLWLTENERREDQSTA